MKKLKTLLSTILLTSGLIIGNYFATASPIVTGVYYYFGQLYYEDTETDFSQYTEWYFTYPNNYFYYVEQYVNNQLTYSSTSYSWFYIYIDNYHFTRSYTDPYTLETESTDWLSQTQLFVQNPNNYSTNILIKDFGDLITPDGDIYTGGYSNVLPMSLEPQQIKYYFVPAKDEGSPYWTWRLICLPD